MNYFWRTYHEGITIGTIGSEGGKIILDEENTFGARITLEGKGRIAPASITFGVNGLMFHTDFFNSIEEGKTKMKIFKGRIDKIIAHNIIEEKVRDENWDKNFQKLIDDLISPN